MRSAAAETGTPVDRLSLLRQHLYTHGPSSIQALADATGASLATVRRDLQRLQSEGLVDRVHGGARIVERRNVEVHFEIRERANIAAKRAIADAAYRLLRPETTILLDNGTTVLQLARRIRLAPLPLTVFTDGLAVAKELAGVPGVTVAMLGGELRVGNLSVIGPLAEATLARMWFDQLFLGVHSVAADGRIYSLDPAGASLNARMLERAAERCVVADASKFGPTAPYLVAPLDAATRLITDAAIDNSWQRRLADMEIATTVAVPAGASPRPAGRHHSRERESA